MALSVAQWLVLCVVGYAIGRGRQYDHGTAMLLATALGAAVGAVGLLAALGMRAFGYDFSVIAERRGPRILGVILQGLVLGAIALFVFALSRGRG